MRGWQRRRRRNKQIYTHSIINMQACSTKEECITRTYPGPPAGGGMTGKVSIASSISRRTIPISSPNCDACVGRKILANTLERYETQPIAAHVCVTRRTHARGTIAIKATGEGHSCHPTHRFPAHTVAIPYQAFAFNCPTVLPRCPSSLV